MVAMAEEHSPRVSYALAIDTPPAPVPSGIITAEDASTEGQHRYAKWMGFMLSTGFVLVGLADSLNSILDIHSFPSCAKPQEDSAGTTIYSSTTCIDARWYRLVYIIGSIFGMLLSGFVVVDRFGRKATVLTGALVFIAGGAWTLLNPVQPFILPLLARGVQGVGIGALAFAIPLLWVELAPKRSRGFLGAMLSVMLCIGWFLWTFMRMTLETDSESESPREHWQYIYVLVLLLAAMFMLGTCLTVCKSPRWVLSAEDVQAAEVVLQRVHRTPNVQLELQAIATEALAETRQAKLTDCNILKRIAIAFVLQSLQQLFSLVTLVIVTDALDAIERGFSEVENDPPTTPKLLAHVFDSNKAAVAMLVVLSSLASLCLVDDTGRRKLLMVGALAMAACYALIDAAVFGLCQGQIFGPDCDGGSLLYLVAAILPVCYGFSWGPVVWIYPFEMFPTKVRAKGVALSSAASFAVVMAIKEIYVELCRVPFMALSCCLLSVPFVFLCCPETKRLSLEKAAALF